MTHRRFLQLYKACLQLYPAKFRRRYAEQMYLTAQDMLQGSNHAGGAAVQLLGDTCKGLVAEHIKQLRGNRMQKQTTSFAAGAGNAVLLGLRIMAVPVIAYVSALPIINYFNPMPAHASFQLVMGELLMRSVPLIIVLLSFRLLASLRLSPWTRVISALVIGYTSGFAFYWSERLVVGQLWVYLGKINQPFVYLYDWLLVAMYLAVFYAVGRKVISRLVVLPANAGAKPQTAKR